MERIAIFPGSFDPFTKGHEDIVRRSLSLFDKVVVALGQNSQKQRYFALDIMIERIRDTFAGQSSQVSVEAFSGLTAEFARQKNARYLLRGLRNTTDFEYENTIAAANRHVNQGLETVFLITDPSLAAINSSIVRDLHRHGADVGFFLPYSLI
jgi:pantetheine-phosphate adenylyltransferase